VAFAVIGRTKWVEVPFYLAGEYTGAFVASACIHAVYVGKISTAYY